MLQLTAENRTFFNEKIAQHCGGDKKVADAAPHAAFVKAVMSISKPEEAERFLSGHLHWLQGKKPRTVEDAMMIARGNISWCFEEGMKKEHMDMWSSLWADAPIVQTKSPEDAFKAAQAVGEKIKAGKDPALIAALARKALQKKTPSR